MGGGSESSISLTNHSVSKVKISSKICTFYTPRRSIKKQYRVKRRTCSLKPGDSYPELVSAGSGILIAEESMGQEIRVMATSLPVLDSSVTEVRTVTGQKAT